MVQAEHKTSQPIQHTFLHSISVEQRGAGVGRPQSDSGVGSTGDEMLPLWVEGDSPDSIRVP